MSVITTSCAYFLKKSYFSEFFLSMNLPFRNHHAPSFNKNPSLKTINPFNVVAHQSQTAHKTT